MKSVIGVLASSGHSLDSILDLTWDQITLVAECIVKHKAETFNAYATPIAESLSGSISKKPKRRTGQSKDTKDKEQRKIDAIKQSGFFVD